ncbi:MAG: helix-turn-helix domain-containing protein [Patescibacteria group bacterium]|jgi:predicted transcriptional regulator
MPNPNDLLTRFNLSEQESELYLAALSLGSASVTDLGKKINKNRTAVYFHLKHLLEKGFIKETRQGKVARFVATPPEEIAEKFDRWTTDFKSLVPMLQSLKKADVETPIIEVIDSKHGYYNVYDEISSLPIGSTFRVLEGKTALIGEFNLLTQDQWNSFFKRIVERKIETKGLFTQSLVNLKPVNKFNKKNSELINQRIWHMAVIPDSIIPFQNMLFIYGDKIAYMFPDTSLVATIKHHSIAESMTLMFDGLYQLGKAMPQGWN